MLKNISVKLRNGIGIKMFRIPIRDGEIFKANINQIRKLFANKSVREIWEHNEDNSKKIKVTPGNYKLETNWDEVEAVSGAKDEVKDASIDNKKLETVPPSAKEESNENNSDVTDKSEIDEVEVPDGASTQTFDGVKYEKVDDNYDPESGIVPDEEDNK